MVQNFSVLKATFVIDVKGWWIDHYFNFYFVRSWPALLVNLCSFAYNGASLYNLHMLARRFLPVALFLFICNMVQLFGAVGTLSVLVSLWRRVFDRVFWRRQNSGLFLALLVDLFRSLDEAASSLSLSLCLSLSPSRRRNSGLLSFYRRPFEVFKGHDPSTMIQFMVRFSFSFPFSS